MCVWISMRATQSRSRTYRTPPPIQYIDYVPVEHTIMQEALRHREAIGKTMWLGQIYGKAAKKVNKEGQYELAFD